MCKMITTITETNATQQQMPLIDVLQMIQYFNIVKLIYKCFEIDF